MRINGWINMPSPWKGKLMNIRTFSEPSLYHEFSLWCTKAYKLTVFCCPLFIVDNLCIFEFLHSKDIKAHAWTAYELRLETLTPDMIGDVVRESSISNIWCWRALAEGNLHQRHACLWCRQVLIGPHAVLKKKRKKEIYFKLMSQWKVHYARTSIISTLPELS